MALPNNNILIVVTGDPVDELRRSRGSFADLIEQAQGPSWRGSWQRLDARSVESFSEEWQPQLDSAAAIIITGSSASVTEQQPWMVRGARWLKTQVAAGTPVLGICFGHQLLAQALGGSVERNAGGFEVGTVTVTRTRTSDNDPIAAGLEPHFAANCIHTDTVTRVPDGAVVLAHSTLDAHQCVRFAPRCYGVQFHPEFDADVMRSYIRARQEPIRAQGTDPSNLARDATDAPAGRQALRNFVTRCV